MTQSVLKIGIVLLVFALIKWLIFSPKQTLKETWDKEPFSEFIVKYNSTQNKDESNSFLSSLNSGELMEMIKEVNQSNLSFSLIHSDVENEVDKRNEDFIESRNFLKKDRTWFLNNINLILEEREGAKNSSMKPIDLNSPNLENEINELNKLKSNIREGDFHLYSEESSLSPFVDETISYLKTLPTKNLLKINRYCFTMDAISK